MTTSIWLMENGFFAVRDSTLDMQPDTATWQRIARYDEALHPVLHQKLSDNVKTAVWANGQLTIDSQVAIDSAWIQARQTELNTVTANKQADSSERAALLDLADAALTQIANDLTAIAQGKTAAQAATTLAQMRTIMLGMLDVQEHTVNRQQMIIKVERAIVRNGLG
jgi:hypothetical protein